MNFSLQSGALLWLIPAAAVVLAAAAWAYRFSLPPLSRHTRTILWSLRAAAVIALLLLLARPLLSLARKGPSAEVAILEDVSLSMTLPATGGEDRASVARRAAGEIERRLAARVPVRRWRFAGRTVGARGDTLPALEPAATALGDALHALSALETLGAVVVVSDGVANRGRDPVQAGRELGVPIHSVVVGEAGGWDASIEEVAVNPTARLGRPAPLEVRLGHTGDTPRRARLTVSDANGVLAEKEVVLPPGGTEILERLSFLPRGVGLSYYRVRLEAGPGERIPENNRRAVVQEVLPDRQRVLLLASKLQWDWTWLVRAIEADSAWAAEYGLWSDGRFRAPPGPPGRGKPVGIRDLARYAVILAQGLQPAETTRELQARLAEHVRSGGGLVLWGGPGGSQGRLGAWSGTPLGVALGIEVSRARVSAELLPRLADEQRLHDIVRLDDDTELNRRFFSALPPLTQVAPIVARPGDRVLVTGGGGNVPLLVLRRVGRGRALLINGSGLWRWGFSGSEGSAPERYRRLWAHALRALAEPTQTEPLRVVTDRALLGRGEEVRVTASLQDDRFQPVSGAEVEVQWRAVRGLDGGDPPEIDTGAVTLVDQGDGSYAGGRPSLPPGRYRVEARARRAGREIARASAEFVVDDWSPEMQHVVPDVATLERLSAVSGGAAVGPSELDRLVSEVTTGEDRSVRWRELRLWENPWIYLLVLALLSSEWWFRRRRGLP